MQTMFVDCMCYLLTKNLKYFFDLPSHIHILIFIRKITVYVNDDVVALSCFLSK